ncbi:MAG: hypothetical protein JWL72_1122 [Ilumatobacteraceae bacterium]|nr:hypothetical protein [Ilumatobacteraceae bacterium]MCU1387784.1 hypothetical protein [Ilumatobacteraceae bacterium]
MAASRSRSFAAFGLVVVIAAGCSGTNTARAVYTDPGGAWQVEFPGKVTVEHTAADVVVYSARYGRDYYGVVDATVAAGRAVNLDDDANNAINSSRDALGAVATDRVITPTTLGGEDARSFTASLVNGKDSSTITGVVVSHHGHVVSAIITDGLSNSAADVKQFIASFVLH